MVIMVNIMTKETLTNIMLGIIFIFLIIGMVKSAFAEDFDWVASFYNEQVDYVFAYGKPMAEWSKYSCKHNHLKKGHYLVYDYNGIPVYCEIKTMTRREYEEYDRI